MSTYRGRLLMLCERCFVNVARSTSVVPFSTERSCAGPQRTEATLDLPFQDRHLGYSLTFGVAVAARRPNH